MEDSEISSELLEMLTCPICKCEEGLIIKNRALKCVSCFAEFAIRELDSPCGKKAVPILCS